MRRHPVSVWPALADLMTVLAVVALFLALSLLPLLEDKGDLAGRLQKTEEENVALKNRFEDKAEEAKLLQERLGEAARNEQMFEAIQEAQRVVDELSADRALRFSADQTLQFGDDLVEFALNRHDIHWKPGGKERLRRFCTELTRRFEAKTGHLGELNAFFTIYVEGHTDNSQCPGDPNCNWWLSSLRAASFVGTMRHNDLCPGGNQFDLKPVGFADSVPYRAGMSEVPVPTRRIAIRLVPNYANIINRFERNLQ